MLYIEKNLVGDCFPRAWSLWLARSLGIKLSRCLCEDVNAERRSRIRKKRKLKPTQAQGQECVLLNLWRRQLKYRQV
jgi:hypothetical protein